MGKSGNRLFCNHPTPLPHICNHSSRQVSRGPNATFQKKRLAPDTALASMAASRAELLGTRGAGSSERLLDERHQGSPKEAPNICPTLSFTNSFLSFVLLPSPALSRRQRSPCRRIHICFPSLSYPKFYLSLPTTGAQRTAEAFSCSRGSSTLPSTLSGPKQHKADLPLRIWAPPLPSSRAEEVETPHRWCVSIASPPRAAV